MEKFEFNSATCTSREQSERLLALGLKKETADMYYTNAGLPFIKDEFHLECKSFNELSNNLSEISPFTFIPAWSLHRLLFLIPEEINIDGFKFPLRSDVIMRLEDVDYMYERLIGIIERVIEQGYFNKDYLV